MKTQLPQRVMAADVYDALELSALIHGGIGTDCFDVVGPDSESVPCCIMGHAMWLDGTLSTWLQGPAGEVEHGVAKAFGVTLPNTPSRFKAAAEDIYDANDCAVTTAIECNLANEQSKISWRQWCQRLSVVRGE